MVNATALRPPLNYFAFLRRRTTWLSLTFLVFEKQLLAGKRKASTIDEILIFLLFMPHLNAFAIII